MRKQGSLDGIILLVISFSVINYVVSESVRLRQADSLFFVPVGTKKESLSTSYPPLLRSCPRGGLMKGLRPLKHPRSALRASEICIT